MPQGNGKGCSGRNTVSDFIVNISTTQDGDVEGVVEHCQSGAVQSFENFVEMIVLITEKLDDVRFPQSSNELRRWTDK